jgi:hypothetical protein
VTITPSQFRILRAYSRLGDWRLVADELGVTMSIIKRATSRAYARLGVNGAVQAFRALGWLR